MITSNIHTDKVRDFLKLVYKIKKHEFRRKENREKLSGHINRIKKITLSKKFNQKTIEEEFDKLENNINEALEKERIILEEQKHGSDIVTQLKSRLDKLEFQLHKQREKQESLEEIKSALEKIHGELKQRKKKNVKIRNREKELEEKIKNKI